ncbi:hypothetical protein G9A89_005195 [Geosiphon pyriformis]|nr:hypothetical protein G9A89_005195 [Geosiphon pyriformis]
MKAVHRRLPVAVRKRLYNKYYPGVLCLLCSSVKFSDHSFTCAHESGIRKEILAETSIHWSVLAGVSGFSASIVLRVLSQCSIDIGLYALICKKFVLDKWYKKACSVFDDRRVAVAWITGFVRFVVELYRAKATVGPYTAIMKNAAKSSSSGDGFEMVLSRKKRRDGVLEDGSSGEKVASKVQESRSWDSETGDTTESESIDMEEECLVEETSFDFGEDGALAGRNHDQTPMSSKVKTKKTLGKLLGKINFSKKSDGDIKKLFALDIGLDKVAGNFSQEKLVVVRKLFSGINGFGGASIPSKFSVIIKAMFTSESSLMKATDKAVSVKILVNTNLKKSSG